jgi:hypothetical protein
MAGVVLVTEWRTESSNLRACLRILQMPFSSVASVPRGRGLFFCRISGVVYLY